MVNGSKEFANRTYLQGHIYLKIYNLIFNLIDEPSNNTSRFEKLKSIEENYKICEESYGLILLLNHITSYHYYIYYYITVLYLHV